MGKHASIESPQDENAMPLPTQQHPRLHYAERQQQQQQQQHLLLHPHHRHQPTKLIVWIKQQQYSESNRRICLCPKEASVWACGKRKVVEDDITRRRAKSPSHRLTNLSKNRLLAPKPPRQQRDGGFTVRYAVFQLPIHVACDNLKKHGNGTTLKAHLETLIAHLAAVYPKGCEKREHHGFLPLHLALKHQASPRTITALLCAAPCTIRELDPSGLTPLELHQIHHRGPDEDAVPQLLARNEDFWSIARCEAILRLKRRRIPAEDDTIGSLTVLAASEGVTRSESDAENCHSDTSQTEDSPTDAVPIDELPSVPSPETAAAAAATAPRRMWCAGRLGHALSESYSKIHELGLSISALKATLQDIETQYQGAGTAESLGLRIVELEIEKDRLHRHVAQLSQELEKCRMEHVSSKSPSSLKQNETFLRMSQERDELRLEVEALKAKNGQYQDLLLLYETNQIRPLETHTKCDNPVENYNLPPGDVDSKSDDLDSVMLYASQFCGHQLRQELVDAWKGASLGGMGGTFASDYDISDLGSSEPTSDVHRESNAINGSFTSHGNTSTTPM